MIDGTGADPRPRQSILIEDYLITDVLDRPISAYDTSDVVLDARDGFVLPGLINHHAHGLTRGPLMIIGEPPLSDARVHYNLDRNLRDGVTTALNVDGFPTTEDAIASSRSHVVTVKVATLHTPTHLRWALDGPFPFGGIAERHRTTAEQMIARGAVAIGETGPGMDGHWADYTLIPYAIAEATGKRILKPQAKELREAAEARDRERLVHVLREHVGVGAEFLPVWDTIHDRVREWAELARAACDEAIDTAVALDLPAVFHHTPGTSDLVIAAAERHPGKVIAAHSNYLGRDVEDTVRRATAVRAADGLVDVTTGDAFGAAEFHSTSDHLFALFGAGLVDLISTDYSGGFWDPMLRVVWEGWRAGVLRLGEGVRMVTANVANAIPGLAPQRGVVAPGLVADLVITKPDHLPTVRAVLTSGVVHAVPAL